MEDIAYYTRRASEERDAAFGAANADARRSHLELADAYDLRVSALRAEWLRSKLHVVVSA